MSSVIQQVRLGKLVSQAVMKSFIDSLQFEHFFIAGVVLAAFLILFNVTNIAKFIYSLIKRRKSQEVVTANSTSDSSSDNQFTSEKRNIFGKIFRGIKKVFKKIFHLLTLPVNFKHFVRQKQRVYSFKLIFFRVNVPYTSIWVMKLIVVNVIVLVSLGLIVKNQFTPYPKIISTYPEEQKTIWNDYTRPIEIEFDVPINKDALIINMAPEGVKGHWEFEKSFSFLPFTRKVKYYPEETFYPGEKIMIYLTDLSNHYKTLDGGEHLVEFYSIELPTIESISIENEVTDVAVDEDLVFSLNQKDGAYVDWEFKFDKEVEYEIVRDNTESISVRYTKPLSQDTKYNLKVYQIPISSNVETGEVIREGEKKEVKKLQFTTVSAPLIDSWEPRDPNVPQDAKVKVLFDNEMDKEYVEEAFSIDPKTDGEISWDDDKTFVFTPSSLLPKATHFTVTLKKGMRSKIGGLTEEDIKLEFDTIGYVKVIGWSPGYGATGVTRATNINVTFDQQVDHASAQSKFSISPGVSGTFSWSGNTMTFNPSSDLGWQTRYTVTVASDVKTVSGLDSNSSFSSNFTTQSQVFTLNVPLYRQTHAFTCNITAAAMVLSYKGAASSEMGVYNGIAKDNTPCTKSGSTITYWGNPHTGYVGNIDGAGDCGGYGVYWGPVSSYMSSRGVSNQIYTGWSVSGLAKEVEKGNPAVIWGQNGWASPTWKSWDSPSGHVDALNGMHSEVVIGFIGSSDNPSHIITNDPWRGRRTLTVGQFLGSWNYFNRTAVVAR
jgi:uncharacterized protein YvpB